MKFKIRIFIYKRKLYPINIQLKLCSWENENHKKRQAFRRKPALYYLEKFVI